MSSAHVTSGSNGGAAMQGLGKHLQQGMRARRRASGERDNIIRQAYEKHTGKTACGARTANERTRSAPVSDDTQPSARHGQRLVACWMGSRWDARDREELRRIA